MLTELYHYLTTPCSRAHRQLGYLTDQLGLQARYQRVKGHWQPHLDNCQQLILQAVQQCSQHHKVTIIGSGQLLDIPLAQLSRQFEQVVLVDVIQTRAIRCQCKKLGNVTPLEHDVTGLAESLINYQSDNELPSPAANLPEAALMSNLIISCNLLTQLAHIPSHYLTQKYGWQEDDPVLHQWQKMIMSEHLSLLAQQNNQCCLICDTKHEYFNKSAQQSLEREDRLQGLSLGNSDQQWHWTIAPFGELDKQYQLIATVQGFYNWSATASNSIKDSQ